MEFAAKEIHLKLKKKMMWTDSQCVVIWIKGKKILEVTNETTETREEIKSALQFTRKAKQGVTRVRERTHTFDI